MQEMYIERWTGDLFLQKGMYVGEVLGSMYIVLVEVPHCRYRLGSLRHLDRT